MVGDSSQPTTSAEGGEDSLTSISDIKAVLHELSPMPKCSSVRTRKRKAEASVVLTSSPYKNELYAKQGKKAIQKPNPNVCKSSTSTGKKELPKKKLTCRQGKRGMLKNLPDPPTSCAPKTVVKSKGKSKPGVKGKGKSILKSVKPAQSQSSKNAVYCLFCDELYIDPPSEDWIQCPLCQRWYHELCSDPDLAHCGHC